MAHRSPYRAKMRTVILVLAGPALAAICLSCITSAITTKDGLQALLFASLAVITGTMTLGWLILLILNIRNGIKRRSSTRRTP